MTTFDNLMERIDNINFGDMPKFHIPHKTSTTDPKVKDKALSLLADIVTELRYSELKKEDKLFFKEALKNWKWSGSQIMSNLDEVEEWYKKYNY